MTRKTTITPEQLEVFNRTYLVWDITYEKRIQGARGMPPSVITVTGKTAFGYTEAEAIASYEAMFKLNSKRKIYNIKATYRTTMGEFHKKVFGEQ